MRRLDFRPAPRPRSPDRRPPVRVPSLFSPSDLDPGRRTCAPPLACPLAPVQPSYPLRPADFHQRRPLSPDSYQAEVAATLLPSSHSQPAQTSEPPPPSCLDPDDAPTTFSPPAVAIHASD